MMWYWIISWCALLWGGLIILLSAFFCYLCSLWRIKVSSFFLSVLSHDSCCCHCERLKFTFRQSCWWEFVDVVYDFMNRYSLIAKSLLLRPLPSFLLLFLTAFLQCAQKLMYMGCWANISISLRPTTLHFDSLWFYVLVSIICKENFPWCGMKTILICDY